MRHRRLTTFLVQFLCASTLAAATGPRFEIRYPASVDEGLVDGRILLLFSTRGDEEPRFHVVSRSRPQPFFGIEVAELSPNEPAVIDAEILGYPLGSLSEIPAGKYWIQAVLNRYTTFRRADGHVV